MGKQCQWFNPSTRFKYKIIYKNNHTSKATHPGKHKTSSGSEHRHVSGAYTSNRNVYAGAIGVKVSFPRYPVPTELVSPKALLYIASLWSFSTFVLLPDLGWSAKVHSVILDHSHVLSLADILYDLNLLSRNSFEPQRSVSYSSIFFVRGYMI